MTMHLCDDHHALVSLDSGALDGLWYLHGHRIREAARFDGLVLTTTYCGVAITVDHRRTSATVDLPRGVTCKRCRSAETAVLKTGGS
jgi:hypothetical protein